MLILYADDDLDDVEIFREIIHAISPSIIFHHANNGKEALDILDNSILLPDYIFLDVNMPVMDGRLCLKEIKKDKRFSDIPVVIYTTSDKRTDIENFMRLGAHKYVIKPTSFKDAVNDLSKILKAH